MPACSRVGAVPKFHWKGVTAQGFAAQGDANAASKESLLDQLKHQQITVSEVVETSSGGVIDTRPPERSAQTQGGTAVPRLQNFIVAAILIAAAWAAYEKLPIATTPRLIAVGVLSFLAFVLIAGTIVSMFIKPEWAQAQVEQLTKRARRGGQSQ